MTSTNDEKDVKSNQTSGLRGKSYYIDLYKTLEKHLSEECELRQRTAHLCDTWRRVHSLCQHSAPSTHPHYLAWLQRHTADTLLQSEWQSEKDEQAKLKDAIDAFIAESKAAVVKRNGHSPDWEVQLVQRGEWFKTILENPWGHPVLKVLCDPRGGPPTDEEILEWLKEERELMFVARLRHLAASRKCHEIALSLATAVMDRVRASEMVIPDMEQIDDPEPIKAEGTFKDIAESEAGFTVDVWGLITDLELVLLHKRDGHSQCIALAKRIPLRSGYQLIERLRSRPETSPREKKLWKNAGDVATLVAQVVIARCMVVLQCSGVVRSALYCCARSLVRLVPAGRLAAAAAALAAPAATARHLHTLATAVHTQLHIQRVTDMNSFVCELYVRAITAGMNELEKLKIKTEKEPEARVMEQTLASWFMSLGSLLAASARVQCECTLTAFSVHPSAGMYDKIKAAPPLPKIAIDKHEPTEETKSEFGSWANDSRGQTNLVKTSETLNLKQTQQHTNVMSTAIFTEGEAIGLTAELCQDLTVCLSGPRVKTLSWDMDREILLANCRSYMERTHGGTRALTTELKYLNLDPSQYQHLPEEEDDENDAYYGIEKGYEHLVELQEETGWENFFDDDETETAYSSNDEFEDIPVRRKKKSKRVILSSDDDSNPLSSIADTNKKEKKKERPHSKERSKERKKKPKDSDNKEKKVNKEKKKRERKKKPTEAIKPGSLASLIGVKIARTNEIAFTDSDYDSQGKSSQASEGNDPNVIFDGLYTMDHRSPDKTDPLSDQLPGSSEVNVTNGQVTVNKPKRKHSVNKRKPKNTPADAKPAPNPKNFLKDMKPRPSAVGVVSDQVKRSITKLLQFRRNQNAGLAQKTNIPKSNAIFKPDYPVQPFVNPKSVIVPEIPKSYINKPLDQTNVRSPSVLLNPQIGVSRVNEFMGPPTMSRFDGGSSQIPPPSTYTPNLTGPVNYNAPNTHSYYQNMNLSQQPHTSSTLQRSIGNDYSRVSPKNISMSLSRVEKPRREVSAHEKCFEDFLKELKMSINAGTGAKNSDGPTGITVKKDYKPAQRASSITPSSSTPDLSIPSHCTKPAPQKKAENAPNTFSRLSYMHKNKQSDIKQKTLETQASQQDELNKQAASLDLSRAISDFKTTKINYMQTKGETVISRVENPLNLSCDSTFRKAEKSPPISRNHPVITSILQTTTSIPQTQVSRIDNETANKVTSPPGTYLSEKDQNDLVLLLRQQNRINAGKTVSRVGILSHDAPINMKTENTPTPAYANVINKPVQGTNLLNYSLQQKESTQKSKATKTKPANTAINYSIDATDSHQCGTNTVITKTSNNKRIKAPNRESNNLDWESVMNAIRAQKTPSRGPSALEMALNSADSSDKSLRNQRIFRTNSVGKIDMVPKAVTKAVDAVIKHTNSEITQKPFCLSIAKAATENPDKLQRNTHSHQAATKPVDAVIKHTNNESIRKPFGSSIAKATSEDPNKLQRNTQFYKAATKPVEAVIKHTNNEISQKPFSSTIARATIEDPDKLQRNIQFHKAVTKPFGAVIKHTNNETNQKPFGSSIAKATTQDSDKLQHNFKSHNQQKLQYDSQNKPIGHKKIQYDIQNRPVENKKIQYDIQKRPVENKKIQHDIQNKPVENKKAVKNVAPKKPEEVAEKNKFAVSMSKNKDPFISGRDDDYNLSDLDDLLDDDIRKELGELSSDEDAYRIPQAQKGNTTYSKISNITKQSGSSSLKEKDHDMRYAPNVPVAPSDQRCSTNDEITFNHPKQKESSSVRNQANKPKSKASAKTISLNQIINNITSNKSEDKNDVHNNKSVLQPTDLSSQHPTVNTATHTFVEKIVDKEIVVDPALHHKYKTVVANVSVNKDKLDQGRVEKQASAPCLREPYASAETSNSNANNAFVVEDKPVIQVAVPARNVVVFGPEMYYNTLPTVQTQTRPNACAVNQAYVHQSVPNITLYEPARFVAPAVTPVVIESVGVPVTTVGARNTDEMSHVSTNQQYFTITSPNRHVNEAEIITNNYNDVTNAVQKCSEHKHVDDQPVIEDTSTLDKKGIFDVNSNENLEQKVISEVQENKKDDANNTTQLKLPRSRSISTEEVLRDILNDQEINQTVISNVLLNSAMKNITSDRRESNSIKDIERLKAKRLAILNREVTQKCLYPPIALSYSPIFQKKPQPVVYQENILKPTDTKKEVSSQESHSDITGASERTADAVDLITREKNENSLLKSDDTKKQLNDEHSKESTVECRRILLRSSNKNLPEIPININDKNPVGRKTKVRLKHSKQSQIGIDKVAKDSQKEEIDKRDELITPEINPNQRVKRKISLNRRKKTKLASASNVSVHEDPGENKIEDECECEVPLNSDGIDVENVLLGAKISNVLVDPLAIPLDSSKNVANVTTKKPEKVTILQNKKIKLRRKRKSALHMSSSADDSIEIESEINIDTGVQTKSKSMIQARNNRLPNGPITAENCVDKILVTKKRQTTIPKKSGLRSDITKQSHSNDLIVSNALSSNANELNLKANAKDILLCNEKITNVKKDETSVVSKAMSNKPTSKITNISKTVADLIEQINNGDISGNNKPSKNDIVESSVGATDTGAIQNSVIVNTKSVNEKVSSKINENITSIKNISEKSNIPQSYKDSIIIEEIPNMNATSNVSKLLRVKLPNGKVYKASVYGKMHTSFDSLFEDPSLRAMLMSNFNEQMKYTLNIKQVSTTNKDNPNKPIDTRIQEIQVKSSSVTKPAVVETINLLSDDEESDLDCSFKTKCGVYKTTLNDKDIIAKHQAKFDLNCCVRLARLAPPTIDALSKNVSQPDVIEIDEDSDSDNVEKNVPSVLNTQSISVEHNKANIPDVILIDDESSNDSIDLLRNCPDLPVGLISDAHIKNGLEGDSGTKTTDNTSNDKRETYDLQSGNNDNRLDSKLLIDKDKITMKPVDGFVPLIKCNDDLESLKENPADELDTSLDTSDAEVSSNGSTSILHDFTLRCDKSDEDDGRTSPLMDVFDTIASLRTKYVAHKETKIVQDNTNCQSEWLTSKRQIRNECNLIETQPLRSGKIHVEKYTENGRSSPVIEIFDLIASLRSQNVVDKQVENKCYDAKLHCESKLTHKKNKKLHNLELNGSSSQRPSASAVSIPSLVTILLAFIQNSNILDRLQPIMKHGNMKKINKIKASRVNLKRKMEELDNIIANKISKDNGLDFVRNENNWNIKHIAENVVDDNDTKVYLATDNPEEDKFIIIESTIDYEDTLEVASNEIQNICDLDNNVTTQITKNTMVESHKNKENITSDDHVNVINEIADVAETETSHQSIEIMDFDSTEEKKHKHDVRAKFCKSKDASKDLENRISSNICSDSVEHLESQIIYYQNKILSENNEDKQNIIKPDIETSENQQFIDINVMEDVPIDNTKLSIKTGVDGVELRYKEISTKKDVEDSQDFGVADKDTNMKDLQYDDPISGKITSTSVGPQREVKVLVEKDSHKLEMEETKKVSNLNQQLQSISTSNSVVSQCEDNPEEAGRVPVPDTFKSFKDSIESHPSHDTTDMEKMISTILNNVKPKFEEKVISDKCEYIQSIVDTEKESSLDQLISDANGMENAQNYSSASIDNTLMCVEPQLEEERSKEREFEVQNIVIIDKDFSSDKQVNDTADVKGIQNKHMCDINTHSNSGENTENTESSDNARQQACGTNKAKDENNISQQNNEKIGFEDFENSTRHENIISNSFEITNVSKNSQVNETSTIMNEMDVIQDNSENTSGLDKQINDDNLGRFKKSCSEDLLSRRVNEITTIRNLNQEKSCENTEIHLQNENNINLKQTEVQSEKGNTCEEKLIADDHNEVEHAILKTKYKADVVRTTISEVGDNCLTKMDVHVEIIVEREEQKSPIFFENSVKYADTWIENTELAECDTTTYTYNDKTPDSTTDRKNDDIISDKSSTANKENGQIVIPIIGVMSDESNDQTCVEVIKKSVKKVADTVTDLDDSESIAEHDKLVDENDAQPKCLLRGIEYEDPDVGTLYVLFPVEDSASESATPNDSFEYIIEDAESEDILNSKAGSLDDDKEALKVKLPKITYSKQCEDNLKPRNLKRKVHFTNTKFTAKKYRKGKNIDYPKITAAAIIEQGYTKEYKRVFDYSSSLKFSYTQLFHNYLDYLDIDYTMNDWPIKGPCLSQPEPVVEAECDLFRDMATNPNYKPSPMEQSLAEEINQDYSKNIEPSSDINEINFSMGFGEGSGRVIQNLEDVGDILEVSAATLSDVKQPQPFLLSAFCEDNRNTKSAANHDEFEKLQRYLTFIKLREKVKAFFQKNTITLKCDWLYQNKKGDNIDSTKFPFDLYIGDFSKPPPYEAIVQVVQVGQLPVSAAAQNPVTCDPRVTQVSDASPSQCSAENSPHDDSTTPIKTEYTELTTADLSLPLDYAQHNQTMSMEPRENQNVPSRTDENIPIETEIKSVIKIELEEMAEEKEELLEENQPLENTNIGSMAVNHCNNDYSYEANITSTTFKRIDAPATYETNNTIQQTPRSEDNMEMMFRSTEKQATPNNFPQQKHNCSPEKTDQIAHAMNAAGITTTSETMVNSRAQAFVNMINQKIRQGVVCGNTQTTANSYPKTSINALALQQALAQILPPPLNQTNVNDNNQQTSNTPQVLHIVQGKNASGSQITLVDNSQQSVISGTNATPVLHIVQNKAGTPGVTANGGPGGQTNSFSGLSLVDAGLQQGGNQLLHIVNTGSQKNNNAGQLLKRVNLLTNLANVQGSNEQKMVQFVCKSADGKSIQLNAPHQRSMVLRLQPIESPAPAPQPKPTENQDVNQTPSATANKDAASQQEIKSRSVYEENYAKFIQNSGTKPASGAEKSTSLPKFNQAFGKPVFQEGSQKPNDMNSNNMSSVNTPSENNECQPNDNAINLEHISHISSPPLLLRKSPAQTSQAQTNLVQQIKQTLAPMNIQTMHGGVIYTRQIPVNIGGGQTINLITVPSTELIDDSGQKQQSVNQGEIEPSIIKIVPQSQTTNNSEMSSEDGNSHMGSSNENNQNPHPQPVLTQMRIKLPMLSKTPQMVSGARVMRPSFFQIQRNIVGGANQPVYQQLVLTAAPPLGQQTIRLPTAQANRTQIKVPTDNQSTESMSSSTLEQLREFDMVLEQVKERSTVQPNSNTPSFSKLHTTSSDTTDNAVSAASTPSEPTQVLYSIGNNQQLNVAYVNRKSTVTPTTSTFVRSPDSSSIADSPTSSTHVQIPHTVTTESTSNESSSPQKPAKIGSKSKSRPKSSSHTPTALKINPVPPKPSTQKPLEDEQTTQRILYILAEYKEQVENSPDKDKPAPRRRSNPPSNPSGHSKRKKSSSGSRRPGMRDMSPIHGDETCRTMGSEDSSCGTSQGDCNESCVDSHSPQDSPRKVAKKLSFEQETPVQQPRPQPQRNVIVADGQTITVARGTAGKPATAVLMPANYILPVSMVKGGQQIAIVTNRGPKLLTVGGEGGATNALLLQRLIGPAGLKPMLARPGVRHVRLPTAALHNLQAFNLATATTVQPPDSTASPSSAPTPDLVETRATSSPWANRESEDVKPERGSSPEGSEPWNLPSSADPHDYTYEETVRADNMDRTVLEPIPDRYSPDLEAQRIFDKMFDVDSKKSYVVDSPRCGYDIDASDCDDKAYQVVHKKDGSTQRHHRLTHVSAAALRHKYAILEHELRLQKSLSEECEDLGVDSPSASELFPEAELLFAASPAHDHNQDQGPQSHTPQPTILNQSCIPQPDIDDQIATDQLLPREDIERQQLELGLEDVGIVSVGADGMHTITLDHEEFARAHPNTTFHTDEPIDDTPVQPFTIAGLKGRHITSTIFHSGRAPATVLMAAPQPTVISQAAAEPAQNIKYADIDNMINSLPSSHNNINLSSVLVKDDGLTRFDSILNDSRELHLGNTASAIVHSTGNATQVIRRVCYDDKRERDASFLMDEPDALIAGDDAKMIAEDSSRDATLESMADVDDDRSSPERHAELFWESNSASERSEGRRPLDFSSDSDKCCKSPSFDETNSTDSSGVGTRMRLDSVIKEARGVERSGSADGSSADDAHPPLRTYPPKRLYHPLEGEVERSLSGKTRAGERSPDSHEVRRRASGRGVVKRGCHCCNGSPAPPRPKKSRQRKPTMDFNTN